MSSKAEKRRRKKSAGRPCKAGMARTETGRISRARTAALPPDRTAREARIRLFNLSANQAAQAEAGSRAGRLRLAGKLSAEQYQAFLCFERQQRQYMAVIQAPDSLRRIGASTGRHVTGDEEKDLAYRRHVKRSWLAVRQAVQTAQTTSSPDLLTALEYFSQRDDGTITGIPQDRIVNFCYATHVLVRHYGFDKAKQRSS